MKLPDCMTASVIMRPNEDVDTIWQATYSERFPNPQTLGTTHVHDGFLLLTNERLIFVQIKGLISKSLSPILAIDLENIAGCSVVGLISKKLEINISSGYQGEPPLFSSFCSVDPATLGIVDILTPVDAQNSLSAAIAKRLADKEKEKERDRIHYVLDFSFLKTEMEKGGIVVQAIKCPNCNASVSLPSSGTSMRCEYCGSTIQASNVFDKIKGLTRASEG